MIAAKPKGRGNHLIHYYEPDPSMAGLFIPICQTSHHAFKAWHLNFKPQGNPDGWGNNRTCGACKGLNAFVSIN